MSAQFKMLNKINLKKENSFFVENNTNKNNF